MIPQKKPGRNEITIHNLTPQADEHSIKVEGHGTDALITDMTVDLIPNYRFNSGSDSDSEDDSDEEPKNPELEQLIHEIKILRRQLDDADESRTSAMKQLSYLDQLVNTLSQPLRVVGPVTSVGLMAENLDTYSVHREKIYGAFKEAQVVCAQLAEELEKKLVKKLKVKTAWDKTLQKASRVKEQYARQKMHERLERQEEKLEVPRFVYRIRITIESDSLPSNTPAIISSVDTGKPAREGDDEPPSGSKGPSLRISYITGGASWTPRYDLRLDTISGTGILTYRAHFFNRTGEIWRNAKLTLSTSQASFSGLEDKVPWLESWRIALRKRGTYGAEKDGGLYSRKEKELKDEKFKKRREMEQEQETDRKPIPESNFERFKPSNSFAREEQQFPTPSALVKFDQIQNSVNDGGRKLMGNIAENVSYSSAPPPPPPPPREYRLHPFSQTKTKLTSIEPLSAFYTSALIGGVSHAKKKKSWGGSVRLSRATVSVGNPYESDPSDSEDDSATLNPPQKMGLAASASESYGLTTTYDLPGLRTIPPSKLLRRHVISEINLPQVELSHICVPKLRAAAFLKARILNPSKTPLLRGPVGLTLDGSFLGNTIVPRCAPDEHFELGLGVDEEVLIEYRKPVRKIAMQGVIVKEQVVTYERCVRIHNARGNLVKLVVFDQVPVSEDDKLRIAISRPRGLKVVGDIVKVSGTGENFVSATGVQVKNPGGMKGYVQAEMRKGGEIRWEVSVEGGKDAVLPLEYEARLPGGEVIYGL